MTVYARPGSAEALMSYESRYDNFIGGEWVAPVGGRYFENPTPITGQAFCEIPRSDAAARDFLARHFRLGPASPADVGHRALRQFG